MMKNEQRDICQRRRDRSREAFHLFLCLNLLFTILSLAIPTFKAEAAYIVVNTTDDELNIDSDCSLREAIQAANLNMAVDACAAGIFGETDEIYVPPGIYTLSIPGSGEGGNATGDLDILEDLTLGGASMDTTIIEGGSGWDDRILDVQDNVSLGLSYLTLRNGNVGSGGGGGLRFSGETLAMYGVRIHDNQTTGDGGGIFLQTDTNIGSFISGSFIHDNSCSGAGCDGGGIYMLSPLSLNTSEVYQNSAQGDGGGIHNGTDGPKLEIFESTIRSNQAALGGGIYTAYFSVRDSTISSNSAIRSSNSAGGGVYYTGSYIGVIGLYNVTVSSNQANSSGGGLWLGGSGFVQINNVTVTANEANADSAGTDYGGGMYFNASPSNFRVSNSIFAQNLIAGVVNADHADCTNDGGTLDTLGHNLQGLRSSTDACDFNYTGDWQGIGVPINALLGPLQDNGGPTHTHALLPGSPAIEYGNPVTPGGAFPACESDDQRGVSRPQGSFCDIGAFEKEPGEPPPVDFDGDLKTDPAKFSASTGTLSYLESSTSTWQDVDMGTGTYDYVSRSDFDGDGKTDPAKFVTAAGALWYLESSSSTWQGIYMGPGSYQLVTGSDFDGDGQTDPALFITDGGANALWYLESSTTTWQGIYMGPGSYDLVEGSDFDGDGATDPALFYSDGGANALWYLESGTSTWQGAYMGPGTYEMVPASDFDGDGESDPALFDSASASLWYLQSSTGTWAGQYMGTGTYDYVAASDFDGDGATDPAEFVDDSDILWWIRSSDSVWSGVWMESGSYEIVN